MGIKEFFGKFVSPYLLWHLFAMVVVVALLCWGVVYGLSSYTHHGEEITVPDLYGVDFDDATAKLQAQKLFVEVSDTGYNKKMEADCILLQTPAAGSKVKEGRTIYVTINSTASPRVKIPDIIDNSSYREAQARLIAIGFKLQEPKVVEGEKDWVYGVMAGSKNLQAGDIVSIETPLMLVIGSGTAEEDEEEMMLDIPDSLMQESDDFIEVVGVDTEL